MSLGDRFKKMLGVTATPDRAELRRSAFRDALASGDEVSALENALAFLQAEMFEDALRAFQQLDQRFPQRRAEWLRWQGQAHYIGMGWRAKTAADRIQCYERALECYFQAAQLGDRSQEFNVVELLEALDVEADVPVGRKRALAQRYLELFPDGEGRDKVLRLG